MNKCLQAAQQQALALFNQSYPQLAKQVTVVSARKVVWRSSALGCPKPQRSYMTVLTDGIEVVLNANQQHYYFHSNSRGQGFFCQANQRQLPVKEGWQESAQK